MAETLSFAMKRLLYSSKGSDTAANLSSVILWSVEAKAAKECNRNLVPVNLKQCCH